nr:hypothetical protein [uncultured Carboxylicivirga sp.]
MKPNWLSQRSVLRLLLIGVSIAAYYFIINRLYQFEHWEEIFKLKHIENRQLGLFFVFICLWACNIFFESKKWQVLISPFTYISLIDSVKQFFAGSFTAVGSPARVAEPGGRMILLDKSLRIYALIMTSIGGFLQNVVIAFFGFLVIYLNDFSLKTSVFNDSLLLYFFIIIAVLSLIIVLFFFKEQIRRMWIQLKKVKIKVIIHALIYSLLRYLVFNIQLIVLICMMLPNINFVEVLNLTPVYFLIITIIPSFFLADIGIRGSTAIFVFSRITSNEPILLVAILLLWLFNVFFPALIGSWILHCKKGLYSNINGFR